MNKKRSNFKKIAAILLCLAILLGILCVPYVSGFAVASNLVHNGDGELSDTSATGWTMVSMENTNETSEAAGKTNRYDKEFTLSAVPGAGVNGTNAIKAAKASSYGYAAMVSDPVAITSGKDYILSYAYKLTDLAIASSSGYALAVRVLLEQYDANGNCLRTTKQGSLISNSAGKITADISQWQTISTGFTAVEGAATCRIYFFMGGMSAKVGFNAWYDNISLVEQAVDQLDNGEFEAVLYASNDTGADYKLPRPAFWNSITTRDTGVPRDDINSLKHYGMVQVNEGEGHETAAKLYVTNADGGFGGVTYYSAPVNVYAGEEYEVQYDLKIAGVLPEDVSNSYGANVMVRYLDANGEYIGNPSRISALIKNNQDWKSYSYKITIPDDAVRMQIGLMIGVGNRNRNKDMAYYFDHMQLIRLESLKDPAITSSALYKKKALFLGDEIGSGLAQYASGYSEMKVTDNTVAGAGFADKMQNQISQQAMPAATELDYVFITGGLFDRLQNVPAGTVNPSVEVVGSGATYAGALEAMFMNVALQYNGVKLAYIFPYQADADLAAYRDVAQTAAQKWNIYFIDLYTDGKLNDEVLKVNEDTYLTDGKLLNVEGFELLWKYLIKTLEQLPAMDASQIPNLTTELLFTARYNGIIGAGVTPATDVESLKILGEKVAENGNLKELEEKIAADLAAYDTYRPFNVGATIAVGDANKLRFVAKSPEKVLPDNVDIVQQGFMVASKDALKEGQLPDQTTDGVMDVYTVYTAASEQYGAYITGKKVDPAVQYVAVAYTLYEINGEQYVLYSTNDFENQLGVKTAESGTTVNAVYEIAREMALYLVQNDNTALDWSYLGSANNQDKIATATEETKLSLHDIFRFVGSNQAVLQKMMAKGGQADEE